MTQKTLLMALPVAAILAFAGCKGQGTEADTAQQEPETVVDGLADTVELELVPVEEEEVTPAEEPRPAPPVRKAARTAQAKAKPETIYVETDGAQGRVWGHVTMRGDRGSGTIHDWDENTLTVTVTRHGNELFAVDQNSRQYVFRLK